MKLILLAFIFSVSGFAAEITVKGSDEFKAQTQKAIDLLPANYLASVTRNVLIEEVTFRSDPKLGADLCHINKEVIFGQTRRHNITISRKLVELARTNSSAFNCSHGSFEKLLQAVIIHELTHVKDNVEKISIDPDFQRIVGVKSVQGSSKNKILNDIASSPDAYEFKNLEEALAVNAEYFILDKEFECRKPATANILSGKLGIPLRGECEKNRKILVQSSFSVDNYRMAVELDPKRIYQIHYLFAGQAQSVMSRWGHAMIRIVMCAPYRKAAGPECLDDLSHHLVLTYRAFITDISLNYAKGMFGGYSSQLFVMKFFEVQQEYTKYQFRDLFSVPLKLTEKQKNDFIDVTLERYWAYQGKYYFFDNNCGTETQKHLALALEEEQSDVIGHLTPLKIYKDILEREAELSTEKVFGNSREELIRKKHLIPSMFDEINGVFQFINTNIKIYKETSFNSFLDKSKASKRLESYTNVSSSLTLISDPRLRKKIVLSIIHLERYLENRYMMEIPKKILKEMDRHEEIKEELLKLGESMKILTLNPWDVIPSRYSAPISTEFKASFESFISDYRNSVQQANEGHMISVQTILGKRYFSAEAYELESLNEIKLLTQRLLKEVE